MKKIVKKMFFVWNEDKEQGFLEEMALKGYILTKVQFGKYFFQLDNPKKLTYQFDFRSFDKMNEEDYLQIYEDAGWSFVCKFGGWYYFSREWTEEEIDLSIFSNNKSKITKYRRLIFFLLVTGFPLYYHTFYLFILPELKFEFSGLYFVYRLIALVFSVLHAFALIKIWRLYRKKKYNIKE